MTLCDCCQEDGQKLVVDIDPATKGIRGHICEPCVKRVSMGIDWLEKAAAYLEEYQPEPEGPG